MKMIMMMKQLDGVQPYKNSCKIVNGVLSYLKLSYITLIRNIYIETTMTVRPTLESRA